MSDSSLVSPSAAPGLNAEAQADSLTRTTPPRDVDGNIYSDSSVTGYPCFTDASTGTTYFLATEQFAPNVDTLVRCSLLLDAELDNIFRAHSSENTIELNGLSINEVSFQRYKKNEDRTFTLAFEHGVLTGIFDGHVGDHLSDYAADAFPPLLAAAITSAYESLTPDLTSAVSSAITSAFLNFDKSVGYNATQLFDSKPIAEWAEAEVKAVLLEHNDVVRRAMAGTTTLVAFISKEREAWVSGVGDCQAFLGREIDGEWVATPLNEEHNGNNSSECDCLKHEHPGEDDTIVVGGRVLGAIAITRAFGDFIFKLPPAFSHHIFRHATPPFARFPKLAASLVHSHTPPYISASPGISHHKLCPGDVIVVSSDGLGDSGLLATMEAPAKAKAFTALAKNSVGVAQAVIDTFESSVGHKILRAVKGDNAAKRVLEGMLWGTDCERKALQLTGELPEAGVLQDDISVVVVRV